MYWVWGFKKNEKSLFFELMTFIDRGKKMYKISLFFGVLRESKISFWYFLTFNANVSFWEKKSKAKSKVTVCKDTKNWVYSCAPNTVNRIEILATKIAYHWTSQTPKISKKNLKSPNQKSNTQNFKIL